MNQTAMLWYLILGEAILILPYSLNSSFKIILLQLYTKSIKVNYQNSKLNTIQRLYTTVLGVATYNVAYLSIKSC